MARVERPLNLDGRWALVTGAAKRIGAVIARTLHAAGANVAIHYHSSASAARDLVADLERERRGSAFSMSADIRDVHALERMAHDVVERAGRLDVLVNNASNFYPTPLGTVTEEQWDDLVGSNLKAPLFLTQALLPALRASARRSGQHRRRTRAEAAARSPGLRRREGGPRDAHALAREGSRTRRARERRVAGRDPMAGGGRHVGPAARRHHQADRAQARGEPEDIAAAVLFLVRDAPYVTGQIIAVDGGRSVGW